MNPYFATRKHLILMGILALSLAQRIWYAATVLPTQLATVPYLDTADYDRWARALTAGDWGVGEPYWMGPLYPHLLALTYAIFGDGSVAILLGQWALTLLNVWLVYRIATRWLDTTWALVAAAMYAGYGPPVFYAGFKLMATVVVTLVLLITWQAQRATDRPTRGRWLSLGLLIGAAALARGNVLVLLVVLPAVLWSVDLARGARWRSIGWLWLGATLAIAPVSARNLIVGGDMVLLTSNLGVNLYIGQQDEHGGRFGPLADAPKFEFDPTGATMLEAELGRDLRDSEVSRELTGRAIARLVQQPGAMVVHYARKAYRFWSGYELPQIYSWNFWRAREPALQALPIAAVWLIAAGLVGGWLLRDQVRRLWWLIVGGWFLGLLPFFPTSRYRQPIMPLLAIAAAAWLAAVITAWRAGRRRRAAALVGATLLLVSALWPTWSRFDPTEEAWQCELNRASRAADVGDRITLLAACEAAEALRPGYAETPYRQGGYLERIGDTEGALAAYREAARRAPDDPFAGYRVGYTLATLGRHREALLWYDQAAAADPHWALPHHGRGLSLRELGAMDDALTALQQAARLAPGRPRYRSNLASLLATLGRHQEAVVILRGLVADFPDYVPGWFNLAVAEWRQGDAKAAQQALDRAAARPDLTEAQEQQIDQLRRQLRRVR